MICNNSQSYSFRNKNTFKFNDNNELFMIIEVIRYLIKDKHCNSEFLLKLLASLNRNAGKTAHKTFTISIWDAKDLINAINTLGNNDFKVINERAKSEYNAKTETDIMRYCFTKTFNLERRAS